MKKASMFLASVIVVAICVLGVIFCSCIANNYTMNGYVDYLTEESIIVVDNTGNEWKYLFDEKVTAESFKEHDLVVIHFNNNGTDVERKDDVITDIKER